MDNAQLKKLRGIAVGYATRKGFANEADDFAQEYIIKMWSGRKASIAQVFVDYLRARYGGTRSVGGAARSHSLHRMQELNTHDSKELPAAIGHSGGDDGSFRQALDRAKATLSHQELTVTQMLLEDVSQQEIADFMGVDGTRVNQLVKSARKKIEKAQKAQALKDEVVWIEMEVDWIKL